jgi:hypothetical protein
MSAAVASFILIAPQDQCETINIFIQGLQSRLPFKIVVFSELEILDVPSGTFHIWRQLGLYPYAIQMALKLLVSKVIDTDFYICLDADVVLLEDFEFGDLVHQDKAIFHNENRFSEHPNWWESTESYLNVSSRFPSKQGFGVTPAVLSTYGSRLVAKFAMKEYTSDIFVNHLVHNKHRPYNRSIKLPSESIESITFWSDILEAQLKFPTNKSLKEEVERVVALYPVVRLFLWLMCFGRDGCMWSEYTLYRIVLDHVELFDDIHVPEDPQQSLLHCGNVWYQSQLPWRPAEALASLQSSYPGSRCLFSVVQSTSTASAQVLLRQLRAFQKSG